MPLRHSTFYHIVRLLKRNALALEPNLEDLVGTTFDDGRLYAEAR